MRFAISGLAVLALLAGCGEARDPAKDAADVAEVEAIYDTLPIQPVEPERISYPDIEQNNLFGAGCGFAPDGGMAIMFLGQANHGFMKLDGEIVVFAPDKGSENLPMGAWSGYDGKEYSVKLAVEEAKGAQEGIESIKFPGKMVVRDMKERIVYQAEGNVGCGS